MTSSETIPLKYSVKFEGRDADRNRLEAYPAAQSLEGFIWALNLTINFGVTGKIRQKGDLSSAAKIFISPPKRGSVINDLNIFVQQNPFLTMIVGGYAVNTVTPYLNALIGHVFGHAIGAIPEIPRGAKRFLNKLQDEDIEKLVTRIEPPLTRAHSVIGKTAETITFKSRRKEIVVLDNQSKLFLEARLSEDFQTIDTNVTSFNVLTGNGRLYHPEEESTVPFSLTSEPLSGTPSVLISSMEQYSLGRTGLIRVTAQRVETTEGRLKKLSLSAAEEIPVSDWVNDVDPLRSSRD